MGKKNTGRWTEMNKRIQWAIPVPGGAVGIVGDAPPETLDHAASVAELITRNWPALAATAWRGFTNEGRGAMMVQSDRATPAPAGESVLLGSTPAAYISDAAVTALGIGWSDAVVAKMVATYDPQVQVVLVFVDGEQVDAYKMRAGEGRSPPPESFTQLEHELL